MELKLEAQGAEDPDHGDVVRRRLTGDSRQAPAAANLNAFFGQQPSQTSVLKVVGHENPVVRGVMIGISNQPGDGNEQWFTLSYDLGTESQLAVVIDEAKATGHFMCRLLEQVAKALPQRVGR